MFAEARNHAFFRSPDRHNGDLVVVFLQRQCQKESRVTDLLHSSSEMSLPDIHSAFSADDDLPEIRRTKDYCVVADTTSQVIRLAIPPLACAQLISSFSFRCLCSAGESSVKTGVSLNHACKCLAKDSALMASDPPMHKNRMWRTRLLQLR